MSSEKPTLCVGSLSYEDGDLEKYFVILSRWFTQFKKIKVNSSVIDKKQEFVGKVVF